MPVTSKEKPQVANVGRPVSRAAGRSRRQSMDAVRRSRRGRTSWFTYVVLTIAVLGAFGLVEGRSVRPGDDAHPGQALWGKAQVDALS